jgi:hypothetical protein
MKSPTVFLQCVLEDLGTRCGISTTQDLKTVLRRVEHEGLSFLTITLSDFGKELEKALDQGQVAPNAFSSFARSKKSAGLPSFLRGFLELVFDPTSGALLEAPSIVAIQALRQFTLMWGKIELPCTDDRTRKAMLKFLECEQDVRLFDSSILSEANAFEDFRRIGRLLWADFFASIDARIYNDSVLPKHGPGATADKLRGNAKYDQTVWTRRMEEIFPHWEHLIPSESLIEWTDGVTILEPGMEIPVKVIPVPKTLKTPRIIAVEPTAMQYMQQGILAVMVEEMARFDNTRNFISTEFQQPNQWLAREGSISGTLATLDLSEASDRVSNQHVRTLLENHRWLRQAVDSTRSRKADVIGYGVNEQIRLAKFASMGSALCFPFEALVFTTVIFMGIEKGQGRQLTRNDVKSYVGRVRVYGDDIIVPVDMVQHVLGSLESFGFKVNRHKSFWSGKFRESCGKEYYDGQDVSIVRVRAPFPESRLHALELASTVSLRNHMYHSGFYRAVDWLDSLIEGIIPFPVVEFGFDDDGNVVQSSPLLGKHSYLPCQAEAMHPDTQTPLVKGAVLETRLPTSRLDGPGALMKWFLKRSEEPFPDRNHLERAGRPVSARIKTRKLPL